MNIEIMKTLFPNETQRVLEGKCPFCSKPVKIEDLKDELSKKEFLISGMCQKCQDEVFNDDSEDL